MVLRPEGTSHNEPLMPDDSPSKTPQVSLPVLLHRALSFVCTPVHRQLVKVTQRKSGLHKQSSRLFLFIGQRSEPDARLLLLRVVCVDEKRAGNRIESHKVEGRGVGVKEDVEPGRGPQRTHAHTRTHARTHTNTNPP